MWRVAWFALIGVGCGRVAFEARGDAHGDAAGFVDDSGVFCAWGPWGSPALVPELSTMFDEQDPAIRADGREIVFARTNAAGDNDLFSARRVAASDPFGAPTELVALDTATNDDGPSFSRDGLTLYWKSEVGGIHLWSATRAALDQTFSNPTLLAGGPFNELGDPSAAANDLDLFEGSTIGQLYVATRPSPASAFGAPELLPAPVASSNWQEGPTLSRDGSTLYFVEIIAGIFEIRLATRPDRASPFGTPTPLPELAGAPGEWDPELSADERTLYFMKFTAGDSNIWMMQRDCVP